MVAANKHIARWERDIRRGRKIAEESKRSRWDHARLSLVVPIGVIVAVAIVCIVVAVLTSAQRADEVSLDREQQLIQRPIAGRGARVLRELESVAATPPPPTAIRDRLTIRNGSTSRVGNGCEPISTTTSSSWSTAPTRSNTRARRDADGAVSRPATSSLRAGLDLLRGGSPRCPAASFPSSGAGFRSRRAAAPP